VLVWAERDGAARPHTLGEMQALSQAYILSRAAPPEACGPEIPAAPARGAMRLARPVRMALDAKGKWAAQEDGWASFHGQASDPARNDLHGCD
jgi:hypothetical protein